MEREKLLRQCIEQSNTGNCRIVDISAFASTTTQIYAENLDKKFYCDIEEH